MQNKCISDRILNYLESYLDKLRNGYEVVVQEREMGCEDEPPYKEIVLKEEIRKYVDGPLSINSPPLYLSDEKFNRLRTDIIEYYNNNIRGEMEYTNQNPITVAGIIIFQFLRLGPGIYFRLPYSSFLTYVIPMPVLEKKIIQGSGFGAKMKRIKIPPIGHYFDERYGPLPKYERGKGGQVIFN